MIVNMLKIFNKVILNKKKSGIKSIKKAPRRLLRLTTTYLLTLNNEKKLLTENYKQLTNLKLKYFSFNLSQVINKIYALIFPTPLIKISLNKYTCKIIFCSTFFE